MPLAPWAIIIIISTTPGGMVDESALDYHGHGTIGYMALEVGEGRQPCASRHSDAASLGVCLLRVLTGRCVFVDVEEPVEVDWHYQQLSKTSLHIRAWALLVKEGALGVLHQCFDDGPAEARQEAAALLDECLELCAPDPSKRPYIAVMLQRVRAALDTYAAAAAMEA